MARAKATTTEKAGLAKPAPPPVPPAPPANETMTVEPALVMYLTPADPPPPLPGAIVVTAARQLASRVLTPGDIIPVPTEAEQRLCAEGAAERLEEWWPGFPIEEPLLDEHRYPVLRERLDHAVWVRTGPWTLRALNACSVSDALLAVARCSVKAILETVAADGAHPSVRQAAKSRLGLLLPEAEQKAGGSVLALTYSGGRAIRAVTAAGVEVNPNALTLGELLPAIERCEHVGVLRDLARKAQQEVRDAALARLAELEGK